MGEVTGAALRDRPVDPAPVISQLLSCARAAWSVADAELPPGLDEVFAAEQALAAQRLAFIAQIDARGIAKREGAPSTAVWLRGRLRIDAGEARQMVRLAKALDHTLAATAQALADGRVHERQARVIHHAIADLPAEVGPEVRGQAEQALVGLAAEFCPAALTRLGSRILEHVAPEVAEGHERERLERGEARAWRDRRFTLAPDGPGRVRLSGCLDSESAATVSAAIESLCSPAGAKTTTQTATQTTTQDLVDDRDPGQRRADALVQVCRVALAGGELPQHGGQRPQVVVTMHYQPWLEHITEVMGRLADGQRVTPATLRRMACDAEVIPVVLGGQGQVLDVGRARRLFTPAIRKALAVRDGGCAFPACDRPATWCDSHHLVPWWAGGVTSLDGGVLLCRPHHRLIHQGDWQVRLGADRLPEFVPPSYVDPEQRPLRNQYHRRT